MVHIGDGHDAALWRKDSPKDFTWSKDAEIHAVRRGKILQKHPEIKSLFGPDIYSAIFCGVCVLIQFLMAYVVRDFSWPALLALTYCVSGTLNHSLQLAMHELSHDLWFRKRWINKWFAYFANLPTGVPSAATFRRYHLEHHTYQGVDGIDTDIPTNLEGLLIRSTIAKLLFVFFMPAFYAFRPMLVKPMAMKADELTNLTIQLLFDFLCIKFVGVKAFFYLVMGSLLGLGLHPISGHFIAEHFEFVPGQETYSYYGPLNWITYNVGYHNEHHDFPKIPGRLLPKVKEYAPEFYDMPSYDSWSRVLFDFIFTKEINGFCRVKRESVTQKAD